MPASASQAAILSPEKKVDREYVPKLADAMRAPSSDVLSADSGLPPVGDLFAADPQLPAGLRLAGGNAALPALPSWNVARPYLTGRFLLEVAHTQQLQPARGEVLQTYPPAVQEALCELCELATAACLPGCLSRLTAALGVTLPALALPYGIASAFAACEAHVQLHVRPPAASAESPLPPPTPPLVQWLRTYCPPSLA